jgi:hypothetical protein
MSETLLYGKLSDSNSKRSKPKFDQSLKIITLLKQKFLIDNMNEIKQNITKKIH